MQMAFIVSSVVVEDNNYRKKIVTDFMVKGSRNSGLEGKTDYVLNGTEAVWKAPLDSLCFLHVPDIVLIFRGALSEHISPQADPYSH